jgi:hypothetical protein
VNTLIDLLFIVLATTAAVSTLLLLAEWRESARRLRPNGVNRR